MVYALNVEQNERIALALVSGGAEPKVVAEARAAFDAALVEEPDRGKVIDAEQWQLRKALGVA